MNPWELLLFGWAGMAVVMALVWWVQYVRGDAGIVDPAWASGIGGLSVFFASQADGYLPRRFLIGALAAIWAVRLGAYLVQRVRRLPEDGRYQRLRLEWGSRTQPYLFAFFQIQAIWSVLFSVPMLVAARNASQPLGILDAGGVVVWLVAIGGEMIADRQLVRFRSDPNNRGKVCRDGLWHYSRHPNYFFEWVHWWTYVLVGWLAPFGWLTLVGPALMLLFLFKVTGIPPTEANALVSRGEAYREYQRTTSAFFPWPPKRQETNS